jgi:hypothetical protein
MIYIALYSLIGYEISTHINETLESIIGFLINSASFLMVLDLMVKPLYNCEMQNLASRSLTKARTPLHRGPSGGLRVPQPIFYQIHKYGYNSPIIIKVWKLHPDSG